jgi:hypothetical protein
MPSGSVSCKMILHSRRFVYLEEILKGLFYELHPKVGQRSGDH